MLFPDKTMVLYFVLKVADRFASVPFSLSSAPLDLVSGKKRHTVVNQKRQNTFFILFELSQKLHTMSANEKIKPNFPSQESHSLSSR